MLEASFSIRAWLDGASLDAEAADRSEIGSVAAPGTSRLGGGFLAGGETAAFAEDADVEVLAFFCLGSVGFPWLPNQDS